MSHKTNPRMRPLMLVCMILLGLQLCFPLRLQATQVAAQHIDVISLGAQDPEDKPGVDLNLDLPPANVLAISGPAGVTAPLFVAPGTLDVTIPTLLVVAGFHPSAP